MRREKDIKLFDNKDFGDLGEKIAQTYLRLFGFEIINCNFRTKEGEIDIIAEKSDILHFIEVKTRKNKKYYGKAIYRHTKM